MIKILLKAHTDTDVTNKDLQTSLMMAAKEGHTQAAELLIENGASVDKLDVNHQIASHLAAFKKQVSMIKLLLNAHADLDIRDSNEGCTALQLAACYNWASVVRLLLYHHADTKIRNIKGKTAG